MGAALDELVNYNHVLCRLVSHQVEGATSRVVLRGVDFESID